MKTNKANTELAQYLEEVTFPHYLQAQTLPEIPEEAFKEEGLGIYDYYLADVYKVFKLYELGLL